MAQIDLGGVWMRARVCVCMFEREEEREGGRERERGGRERGGGRRERERGERERERA